MRTHRDDLRHRPLQLLRRHLLHGLQQLSGGQPWFVYYKQYGQMHFPGRKKHPSTDPANALLSFGYVLLTNEIAALLEARGFDPAIGFFHGIRYGRQSLSLDVVEVFPQPARSRAIADLLPLHIEPTLSAACRAFRKGHPARSTADDVGRRTENGLPSVLRADVRSCFDNICRAIT